MSFADKKVWFITGASSGIGRAVATHLLEQGDPVVATLRKPDDIADLVNKYPKEQLLALKLDVVSTSDIEAAFAAAIDKFGRIDVIYNNAAYGSVGEIEGTPEAVVRGMFDVNFWGATNVAREAIRVFRDVNKPSGGRLLQVSSMAGISARAGVGFYSASKYALEGISQALASELHPSWNITVTILELGSYNTLGAQRMAVVPPHPAYTAPDSTTKILRDFLINNPTRKGDPNKAAREIRKVGLDNNAGLRVPLGLDAIDTMNAQLVKMKKDIDDAAKWNIDLKL